MPDAQQLVVRAQEKSWPHLAAGGAGGIATAIATAPLDVLRTRLQSNIYSPFQHSPSAATATPSALSVRGWLQRARITSQNLLSTQRIQGWRGLYTGLGPSILGVAPATAIKFYTYGNCKRIYASWFKIEDSAPGVHVAAAATAGIVTGTATNPIWLIKTRLQLDHSTLPSPGSILRPRYRNSFHCAVQIFRQEGIRGFYRGLSASYLGVAESALHLVLYERIKDISRSSASIPLHAADHERSQKDARWNRILSWLGVSGSAGIAKLIAGVIAYPHEVVRTRLRQAPLAGGRHQYTSLNQCIRTIWREEGFLAFYGGITPHMLRAVPSAAITLGVYEAVLKHLR
ncbi:carrier protein Rim2p/Mrs12p [Aureobasidium pullulans]|uniref:Carrier protein Rim2p/Mrs12p n=1 Tax=Aureobasidium pullulans TaxID=5580 RepID=A0A4T0BHA9_AURPU|nr:carrier protein Rim2p/Mrs12p [Aureobasidium pullulans]